MRKKLGAKTHNQFVTAIAGPRPVETKAQEAPITGHARATSGVVHAVRGGGFMSFSACVGRSFSGMPTHEPVTCKACLKKGFH